MNQFPECLPYIVNYTFKLMYKGRNLLSAPTVPLAQSMPNSRREIVTVLFVPNTPEAECSMVADVDSGQMDQPEVSDILMISEEREEAEPPFASYQDQGLAVLEFGED